MVHGCMRLAGDGSADARRRGWLALEAAVEAGINHFDHADIYGRGACESLFGEFLAAHPGLRKNLILTSKCGILLPGSKDNDDDVERYDSSSSHIQESVDGILARLGVEQLDVLLLHRPDYLINPQEVATTFARLHESGKVAHFGVSNYSVSQVDLLQSALPFPLVMNQVEFNIERVAPLDDGVLDQCMAKGMTFQSWCPLGGVAYPAWGSTLSVDVQERIRDELARQATVYACDPTDVILAWILFHPAGILPIIGTMNADRIRQAVRALDLPYTRRDWYRLLHARRRL